MRPNLSLENIAGALAVLGTGVIMAACGGDPKTPVNANEVNGATEKAADGASHCGAGKDHKAGEASCSADKKTDATSAAKPDTAATTPAAATPAAATPPATPAAADPKAATPAATGTAAKKPGAAPAPAPAKKGGGASCGAGTCGTKK